MFIGELFLAENFKVYNCDGSKKGGINSEFVKLNKGFNNSSYLNLLENHAFPSIKTKMNQRDFIYMHDNASIHVKKEKRSDKHSLARNLIVRRLKSKLLIWPPYSPDMNHMENTWFLLDKCKNDELDRRFKAGEKLPANKREMFSLIKECWLRLDNRIIQKVYFSFRKRLINCLIKRGCNNFSTKSSKNFSFIN